MIKQSHRSRGLLEPDPPSHQTGTSDPGTRVSIRLAGVGLVISCLCVVGHEAIKHSVRVGQTAGLEGGYLAMLSIPIWILTLLLSLAVVGRNARRVAAWACLVVAVCLPLFLFLEIWTALVQQFDGTQ